MLAPFEGRITTFSWMVSLNNQRFSNHPRYSRCGGTKGLMTKLHPDLEFRFAPVPQNRLADINRSCRSGQPCQITCSVHLVVHADPRHLSTSGRCCRVEEYDRKYDHCENCGSFSPPISGFRLRKIQGIRARCPTSALLLHLTTTSESH
jgi:hypothetical protein